MVIEETITVQGRILKRCDIVLIKSLIKKHPSWHRTRLSRELCRLWNWNRSNGSFKDMACRSINNLRSLKIPLILHSSASIESHLCELYPLIMEVSLPGSSADLFNCLMYNYHYLSFKTTVSITRNKHSLSRKHLYRIIESQKQELADINSKFSVLTAENEKLRSIFDTAQGQFAKQEIRLKKLENEIEQEKQKNKKLEKEVKNLSSLLNKSDIRGQTLVIVFSEHWGSNFKPLSLKSCQFLAGNF